MLEETQTNSKRLGAQRGRSETALALSCVLLVGLRISLAVYVLSWRPLAAQENPDAHCGQTGAHNSATPCAVTARRRIQGITRVGITASAMVAILKISPYSNRAGLGVKATFRAGQFVVSDAKAGPRAAAIISSPGIAIGAFDASSLASRFMSRGPSEIPSLAFNGPSHRSRNPTTVSKASATPGSGLFGQLGGFLSPHFRVCTCETLAPVPVKLPGTRTRVCAMACQCDAGAFGIGLYTARRLVPVCSLAAETICPCQIKTISPSGPAGLALPFQFTVPQIVGCRLLESRPWDWSG